VATDRGTLPVKPLPEPPAPRGRYLPVLVHNGIAYVSGQVSRVGEGVIAGRLRAGDDLTQAREAARVSALRCLSALEHAIGGLDRIEQILSVRGFVNSDPSFVAHAQVIDAASEVFLEALGSRGRHARIALGVASIPSGGLVEIELTAAVFSSASLTNSLHE
jgi:enamine deaminase RidA (YjgF/YER057c/UK114 family)